MLETYKLMDEVSWKKKALGPEGLRERLVDKYFPDDDDDDTDVALEDIIKDDDEDSSDGN